MTDRSTEQIMARHRSALAAFSEVCTTHGLSHLETIIVASYFVGQVIAAGKAPSLHDAQLTVASQAMHDAYAIKTTRNIILPAQGDR